MNIVAVPVAITVEESPCLVIRDMMSLQYWNGFDQTLNSFNHSLLLY